MLLLAATATFFFVGTSFMVTLRRLLGRGGDELTADGDGEEGPDDDKVAD